MRQTLIQNYRDKGHEKVEGWGVDRELIDLIMTLDRFQSTNQISGHLCEIGVHHGRTLILLALLSRERESVWGIDLFESAQLQNIDASGSGLEAAVRKNLQQHAPSIPVNLVACNSFHLSQQNRLAIQGSRLVHIDGGHFLEVVLHDLDLAQNILGSGGIIILDDYWHSGFPEVQEAAHRFFSTATTIKAVPFMTGKNKLFLVDVCYYNPLLAFLQNTLPSDRNKRVKLLGYEGLCYDPH